MRVYAPQICVALETQAVDRQVRKRKGWQLRHAVVAETECCHLKTSKRSAPNVFNAKSAQVHPAKQSCRVGGTVNVDCTYKANALKRGWFQCAQWVVAQSNCRYRGQSEIGGKL